MEPLKAYFTKQGWADDWRKTQDRHPHLTAILHTYDNTYHAIRKNVMPPEGSNSIRDIPKSFVGVPVLATYAVAGLAIAPVQYAHACVREKK